VYIPLGGNRVGKLRHIVNILIVWGLTGFWHGAEWNFIIWGLYYGAILLIEKTFLLGIFEKIPSAFRHIYTLFLTVIGFTIFNSDGMGGVAESLSAMFGAGGLSLYNAEALYYLASYAVPLLLAALLSTPLAKKIFAHIESKAGGEIAMAVVKPVCYIAILLVCTASLIDGSFNPFIYFRF
jgi:alginate O-acetyltransferase complex protein AlgI